MFNEPLLIEEKDMAEYVDRWLKETKEAYPFLAGEGFFGEDLEELEICA